jgi:hypothetical protein
LLKDEVKTASSSWLYGKEARHSVTTSTEGEATPEGEREETIAVGLTRILLGQKIKKTHVVDSIVTNGQ